MIHHAKMVPKKPTTIYVLFLDTTEFKKKTVGTKQKQKPACTVGNFHTIFTHTTSKCKPWHVRVRPAAGTRYNKEGGQLEKYHSMGLRIRIDRY